MGGVHTQALMVGNTIATGRILTGAEYYQRNISTLADAEKHLDIPKRRVNEAVDNDDPIVVRANLHGYRNRIYNAMIELLDTADAWQQEQWQLFESKLEHNLISIKDLEAKSWVLAENIVNLHEKGGTTLSGKHDAGQRSPIDNTMKCSQRMEKIIDLLCRYKLLCIDMMDSPLMFVRFVTAPQAVWKEKKHKRNIRQDEKLKNNQKKNAAFAAAQTGSFAPPIPPYQPPRIAPRPHGQGFDTPSSVAGARRFPTTFHSYPTQAPQPPLLAQQTPASTQPFWAGYDFTDNSNGYTRNPFSNIEPANSFYNSNYNSNDANASYNVNQVEPFFNANHAGTLFNDYQAEPFTNINQAGPTLNAKAANPFSNMNEANVSYNVDQTAPTSNVNQANTFFNFDQGNNLSNAIQGDHLDNIDLQDPRSSFTQGGASSNIFQRDPLSHGIQPDVNAEAYDGPLTSTDFAYLNQSTAFCPTPDIGTYPKHVSHLLVSKLDAATASFAFYLTYLF